MFRVHRPKTNVFRNREHNSRVWLDSVVILSSQKSDSRNLQKPCFAAWMVKCERLINKLPFCCPFYLYELFRCLSCDPVSDFSSDRVIKILCYLELRSLRSGNAYDFYTCILRSQILELPWGPWERQTCSNYREV